MKKQLRNIFAVLTVASSIAATAQSRYDDPIFTNAQITITPDITYGTNQAISLTGGAPAAQALRMDVYQPNQSVDAVANRPLIIVLHTGNFLPAVINGSPTGSRKDSAIVQACMEFA